MSNFEEYLASRLQEAGVRQGYEDALDEHGLRHLQKVLAAVAVVVGAALVIHVFRKD